MKVLSIRSRLSESGQTVAEYALIVSAIAVALIGLYDRFGSQLGGLVNTTASLIH